MSGYVPMPMPIIIAGGGGTLPLAAAWILGGALILISIALGAVTGWFAKEMWEDDLRFLSVIAWSMVALALIGIPYLVINFIIIPAYGA